MTQKNDLCVILRSSVSSKTDVLKFIIVNVLFTRQVKPHDAETV